MPLFTYNMDRKEKIKNYKQNPFNTTNWAYDEATVSFLCPNDKKSSVPVSIQPDR